MADPMGDLFAKSLCAGLALALSAAVATAAEIRVVSVGALQNALKPIGAEYAKRTARRKRIVRRR